MSLNSYPSMHKLKNASSQSLNKKNSKQNEKEKSKNQLGTVSNNSFKKKYTNPIQLVDLSSIIDKEYKKRMKQTSEKHKNEEHKDIQTLLLQLKRSHHNIKKKDQTISGKEARSHSRKFNRLPELQKKKKAVKKLKKNVLKSRRYLWFLYNPEIFPVPLQIHPALIGYYNRNISKDENSNLSSSANFSMSNKLSDNSCTLHQELEKLSISEIGPHSSNHDEFCNSNQNLENSEIENFTSISFISKENQAFSTDRKISTLNSFLNNHDSYKVSPIFFTHSLQILFPISKNTNSPAISSKKKESTKKKFETHIPNNRYIKEYVTQSISQDLNNLVASFLSQLFYFQERDRLKNNTKRCLKRRICIGISEVVRKLKFQAFKCIIMACNIEQMNAGSVCGGLRDVVHKILERCEKNTSKPFEVPNNIPVIFSLSKKKLGAALGKKIGISMVGIFSTDGVHEKYLEIIDLAKKLKQIWLVSNQKEIDLANQSGGIYALCHDCQKFIEIIKYECTQCGIIRCLSCSSSKLMKNTPCHLKKEDKCHIVLTQRTVPLSAQIASKKKSETLRMKPA